MYLQNSDTIHQDNDSAINLSEVNKFQAIDQNEVEECSSGILSSSSDQENDGSCSSDSNSERGAGKKIEVDSRRNSGTFKQFVFQRKLLKDVSPKLTGHQSNDLIQLFSQAFKTQVSKKKRIIEVNE